MPQITPAHLHVLINHIPIIGLPIVALVLIWGLVRREESVIRTALIGAVLIALGTWAVDLTGDPAIHDIRQYPWFQRAQVHAHELAGDRTNYLTSIAGVAALLTLILARGGKVFSRGLALLTVALLLFAAMCAAWAGWEGGKIRHDEFRGGAPGTASPAPDAVQRIGLLRSLTISATDVRLLS